MPEPEDTVMLKTSLDIYRKFDQYMLALRCAIQLNDMDLIYDIFYTCKDR